ncbi:hypothetical protein Fmac_021709 [Flemingia macrophylla]|uniref:Wound-responsive family protein n=1 Tax=Flemingia macrophylla TaxID=520843 RepID=A0ABD1LXN3_9FABA
MSSVGSGWIVATSVGVVEALKDQGLCGWNYALRLAQKQVKIHVRSLSQTNKLFSSAKVSTSSRLKDQKQSEESLRTVMKNYKMSSSAIKAWSVAASVGVVEALKDQGICRWNHALRSAQQHVKTHVGSFSQTKKLTSSSAMVSTRLKNESGESLRTVMYLSCWGPN